MTLIIWRTVFIAAAVFAVVVCAYPLRWLRRVVVCGLLLAGLIAITVFAASRVSMHTIVNDVRPFGSWVHVSVVTLLLGLLMWLLWFSRETWSARSGRLAAVAAFAILLAIHDVHFTAISGVRSEFVATVNGAAPIHDTVKVDVGDWPMWRGWAMDGVASGCPQTEGRSLAVSWEVFVPGEGHSSPVVWGKQVYVTTSETDPPRQIVLAIDLVTRVVVWETVVRSAPFLEKHVRNSYASSSPCVDGDQVYSLFANKEGVFLTALRTSDGQIQWDTRLGDYYSEYNLGASPIILGANVIVAVESYETPSVQAVNRATGRLAWRTRLRLEEASYATPCIAHTPQGVQVVLPTRERVVGLDPNNGKSLWAVKWKQDMAAATPVYDNGRVFVTSKNPTAEVMALEVCGKGTPSVVWQTTKGASNVVSPVVLGAELFLFGDEGVVTILDASTGDVRSRKRVGAGFAGSPLVIGDRLLAVDIDGVLFLLEGRGELKIIDRIALGEPVQASPIVAGETILVRGRTRVFVLEWGPGLGSEAALSSLSVFAASIQR